MKAVDIGARGTPPDPEDQPAVFVRDQELVILNLIESDPEVLDAMRDATDLEVAAHSMLQMGARALRMVRTSVDTAVIESAFGEMKADFDRQLADTVEDIAAASDRLLDQDEGALPTSLSAWKQEVAQLLEATFDPDSKRSVLGRLDQLLEQGVQQQVDGLGPLLDPADPSSPMGKAIRALKEQAAEAISSVTTLAEQLGAKQGEDSVVELTTAKGFTFEELAHEMVSSLAAQQGDVADRCGSETGLTGSKVGDEVVDVNRDDLGGAQGRYVLEAKDRKLGLRAILDEVGEAMKNRGAAAGIAMFSRQELAPTDQPFQPFGDKAIVVLDKDDPDPSCLRLACLWARWTVRRSVTEDDREVDIQRIESLIDEGRRSLERVATIRRAHTSAQRKIEEASGAVDLLAGEFTELLGELENETKGGAA